MKPKALRSQREVEYEAAKKLSKKGYRAETELAATKAALEAAEAMVSLTEEELSRTVIRAPFTGFIDDRAMEIGDYLDTGDPVATLVDLERMLVVAQVSERKVGHLVVGSTGHARLIGGEIVEGRLRFVSAVADPATRTFRVELEVDNRDHRIADGVTAELRLPLAEVPAYHLSPAVLTLGDNGGDRRQGGGQRPSGRLPSCRNRRQRPRWSLAGGTTGRADADHRRTGVRQGGSGSAPLRFRDPGRTRTGASLMNALIDAALSHARTVLSTLVLILVAGSFAYVAVPKEAEPDINIPILYVTLFHEGISPEDAERLLIKPMESELSGIEGVKEMRSTAYQGGGNVVLEFDAGFDVDLALADVREKVDIAKSELPEDAEEPSVHEINLSLFPVLVVTPLRAGAGTRTAAPGARPPRQDREHSRGAEGGDFRRPRRVG